MRHLSILSALLFCALTLPAFAQQDPFSYDATKPLRISPGAVQPGDGIETIEITFDGLAAGEVRGTIVRPAHTSASRRPGILWVHWLGDPATTNRTEFLADARALAAQGAISLSIDALWAAPDWYDKREPANDEQSLIAQVVAIRRALDVLLAQPSVDPDRIVFVGHDFGAMTGALAAAVDQRIRYGVFMAPSPSFWEWMLYGPLPKDVSRYVTMMSVYDLPRWVPRATFSASLWQFGKRDPFVAAYTSSQAKAWIPDRMRAIRSYDIGHDLVLQSAIDDRREWLARTLKLTPSH